MKLFSRLKHAAEAWLRTIVAEEASKIDVSLHHEKEALQSHLRVLDAQITTFNAAVERLVEISYYKENSQLRADLKELNGRIADVISTTKQLHPTP
jgi:peptidoglycan hydrolase CwlO-like protein